MASADLKGPSLYVVEHHDVVQDTLNADRCLLYPIRHIRSVDKHLNHNEKNYGINHLPLPAGPLKKCIVNSNVECLLAAPTLLLY